MKILKQQLKEMVKKEVKIALKEAMGPSSDFEELWNQVRIAIDDYQPYVEVSVPVYDPKAMEAKKTAKELVKRAVHYGRKNGVEVVDWDISEPGEDQSYDDFGQSHRSGASLSLIIHFQEM